MSAPPEPSAPPADPSPPETPAPPAESAAQASPAAPPADPPAPAPAPEKALAPEPTPVPAPPRNIPIPVVQTPSSALLHFRTLRKLGFHNYSQNLYIVSLPSGQIYSQPLRGSSGYMVDPSGIWWQAGVPKTLMADSEVVSARGWEQDRVERGEFVLKPGNFGSGGAGAEVGVEGEWRVRKPSKGMFPPGSQPVREVMDVLQGIGFFKRVDPGIYIVEDCDAKLWKQVFEFEGPVIPQLVPDEKGTFFLRGYSKKEVGEGEVLPEGEWVWAGYMAARAFPCLGEAWGIGCEGQGWY
ncbi:hypothetical protein BJ508DRAFT_334845 [Ascobolus immersus RN42]|uniref:Uncharacterized protein n=1 Tax=Ascobolus immersus RN42 TaxID=1160509 RepID=A0A3N4HEQ8_ASCIM|nr:hypothetical protein BJ508DRAFT_334845 [Ascobolus immersus RN42]